MKQEEDIFEETDLPSEENPNAIELKEKSGKRKRKNGKKHKRTVTDENGVHKEVFTTVGDGFQRIEVTEIHMMGGGGLNNGNPFGGMGMGMGMPTIIIGKPRNLKMRGEEASPFKMMRGKN
jgi:hypothetical protein